MRPDTIAAVGPDFIREQDGLLVRMEEDKLPTPCIAQNKVAEHRERQIEAGILAALRRASRRGWRMGFWYAVLVSCWAWIVALWFVIVLRDQWADAWLWMKGW